MSKCGWARKLDDARRRAILAGANRDHQVGKAGGDMKQTLGVLAVLAVGSMLAVRLVVGTAAHQPAASGPLSTALVVMAPELTSLVQVAYVGVAGDCAGKTYDQGPVSVPAGAAVRIEPGPKGAGVLPEGCIASARITTLRGAVVAQSSLEDDRAVGGTLSPVAGFIAPPVDRSATELAAPRFGRGLEDGSSLLMATNAGDQTANVVLTLVDEKGTALPAARCPECSRTIPADGAVLWDAAKINGLPEGQAFAAFVAADQPLAAAVAQVPAAGIDLAMYAAMPVGADPVPGYLPSALVGDPANPPFDTSLDLQNMDHQAAAQAALELRTGGAGPVVQQLGPLLPGATGSVFLPDLAALTPGSWSAILTSDRPLAYLARMRWLGKGQAGGHGAYTAPEISADVVVPQFVQADGLLSIFNSDTQTRAPTSLDVLPMGDAKAVFSTSLVIPPGAAQHLILNDLEPTGQLPLGFLGTIRLRAEVPLAVAALLPTADGESVTYLEAAAASSAASDVVAPLVFSGWGPDQPPPTPTATSTEQIPPHRPPPRSPRPPTPRLQRRGSAIPRPPHHGSATPHRHAARHRYAIAHRHPARPAHGHAVGASHAAGQGPALDALSRRPTRHCPATQ